MNNPNPIIPPSTKSKIYKLCEAHVRYTVAIAEKKFPHPYPNTGFLLISIIACSHIVYLLCDPDWYSFSPKIVLEENRVSNKFSGKNPRIIPTLSNATI